jgi:general stress protein 26
MAEKMTTFDPENSKPGFVPSLEELRSFLIKQKLGCISTNGEGGYPNNAKVAFSVHPGFEIVIGTAASTDKVANIARDPKAGFETTDTESRQEVQLTADAALLTDEEFLEHYAELHYAQRPESLPFKDLPGQAHIVLTPVHLKYTDADANPWQVTHFTGEDLAK